MEELGVLARLAAETRPNHGDADSDLEHLLEAPSAQAYRAWLLHRHGLLAPLEAAFDSCPRLGAMVDLRARRKAPRLRSDLLALGVALRSIAAAPTCTFVPARFATPHVALGWMYVTERTTLTFGNAFRALARALPGEIAFGSEFLKAYGTNVGVMWRAFAAALDTACDRPEHVAAIVGGAHDAFRATRRWDALHFGARGFHASLASNG